MFWYLRLFIFLFYPYHSQPINNIILTLSLHSYTILNLNKINHYNFSWKLPCVCLEKFLKQKFVTGISLLNLVYNKHCKQTPFRQTSGCMHHTMTHSPRKGKGCKKLCIHPAIFLLLYKMQRSYSEQHVLLPQEWWGCATQKYFVFCVTKNEYWENDRQSYSKLK